MKLMIFSSRKSQGLKFKVHQRQAPGFVRPLQRSQIHPDEASLVVESEQSVRSIVNNEKSHGNGALPRGGSLRRGGLPARSPTYGAHLQAQLREVQRSVVGYIFKDVQLFYGF